MKQTLVLILIIVAAVFAQAAAAAERMLGELAGLPGIELTYVGPAGMQFAGQVAPMADIGKAQSVEVAECDKDAHPETYSKARALAQKLVKQLKMQTMVESRDGSQTTHIFTAAASMLIETTDGGKYTLVLILGDADSSTLGKSRN